MIDFNNDALGRIADSITPLIGSEVRIFGCFEDGRDYTYGTLWRVEATDDGAIIYVENDQQISRLHAFQEAHRILVDD